MPNLNRQQTNEILDLLQDKKTSKKQGDIFKIYKSEEILKMTANSMPFIVDRMIAEKTITAITAKSGVGKSLIALILATHISRGEKLFNEFNVMQKNVLIVDQEMPDDILIDRYKAIVKEWSGVDYMWEQSWIIEDTKHYDWMVKIIKENKYGVIIFDMLDSIHEKNENDNSEMKVINKRLIRLINETGVTIILLHQHRKEDNRTKSSQDSAQGAGDIIHKASSHLIIEQLDKGTDKENNKEIAEYLFKQVKSRRPETMQSFKFEVIYNLNDKKTNWNFLSFYEEKMVAIEKARGAILEFLNANSGYWYLGSKKFPEQDMLLKIKEKTGGIGDKNIKEAIKSLVTDELINSFGKSPIAYFIE